MTSSATSASESNLQLNLQQVDNTLELMWNPFADSVVHATHGELTIRDGKQQSSLQLTPPMLRTGKFTYWPVTSTLNFKLDVYVGNRKESAELGIGANAAPKRSSPGPGLAKIPEPPPPPDASPSRADTRNPGDTRKATSPVAKAEPRRTTADSKRERDGVNESHRTIVESRGTSSKPRTASGAKGTPAQSPSRTGDSRPAALSAQDATPDSSGVLMGYEPVGPSTLQKAAGKVPVIGKLTKSSGKYEPPRPLQRTMPTVSKREREGLAYPLSIQVMVYIDSKGHVESAEPMVRTAGRDSSFAIAAVAAAQKWRFTPARIGNEQVPGKVILHFTFQPL